MKGKTIGIKKLYILSAVLLVTSTQAAVVTNLFSDTFTGADGTAITNDNSWGYVDNGVEIEWQVIPRLLGADLFEIQSNALHAEITPMETNNPAAYNKVMAAIYPKSGGSQVSANIAGGEKAVFKVDLTDFVNNLGHRWGLNQELKLVLTESPNLFDDPNSDPNSHLKITFHPSDAANQFTVRGTDNRTGKIETPEMHFTNSAALPMTLTIEHYSSGTTVYLLDDTLVGTISDTAMPTVYPYMWLGKFQGEGSEVTAGSVTLDNVEITVEDAGTAPDAATDFAADVPASGTIDLSWTDVATNELGYRLERQEGAAAYTNHAVLAANATSYQDTGLLTDGTTYSYRLTAFNGAGDSATVETSTTAMVDVFANWAANYLVLSGSKENTVDYDNDGASDFREYALNGNPTNDTDTGMVETINDGTTFSYIYAMRTDDTSLTYTLVNTDDLVDGSNSTNNYDSQTLGPSGVANFNSVTNNYNMIGNPLFIKLIIE